MNGIRKMPRRSSRSPAVAESDVLGHDGSEFLSLSSLSSLPSLFRSLPRTSHRRLQFLVAEAHPGRTLPLRQWILPTRTAGEPPWPRPGPMTPTYKGIIMSVRQRKRPSLLVAAHRRATHDSLAPAASPGGRAISQASSEMNPKTVNELQRIRGHRAGILNLGVSMDHLTGEGYLRGSISVTGSLCDLCVSVVQIQPPCLG